MLVNTVEDKAKQFFAAFDAIEAKLADLEFLGVAVADVREAMAGFESLREELALVDSQIAALRPSLTYREDAERLAGVRAGLLVSLENSISYCQETLNAARLGAFADRIRLLLPFQDAVLQADTAALAALQSFADSMPAVVKSYQDGSKAQRVMHVIGRQLQPEGGAIGEGRPAPPFARGGDPNPGPVASWVRMYIEHFLALSPAPGSAEQDLAWFYQKVR